MTLLDNIIQDLDYVDSWEERYHYLIELGKKLPPMPEEKRTSENKIPGCISQIWVISHSEGKGEKSKIILECYSDTHIIRGLLLIIMAIYSGKTVSEVFQNRFTKN